MPQVAIPLADPVLTQRLVERLAEVEQALAEVVTNADELADDASRHLLAAGGKRLRPLLVLLAGALGDGEAPELVDAAVVVELTHLASLYHDDVMDSAGLRRGAPTVHAVWGNTVAILVGDLLFARASARVADLGPDAVKLQAATFERLCLGQLHETTGPRQGDDPVAHYIQVLADKTASLLATSARFGAIYGGCSPEIQDTVAAYGEKMGVAFQLADDVLDLASTGAQSGKTQGTDLREHVPTMPVLLLRQRVAAGNGAPGDAELLARLDGDLSDDAALAAVVADLGAHHVVDETRTLAARWARAAADELAPLPAGPITDALAQFALALADRTV